MSRGRLVVHAHFYQPERRDPFSGRVPPARSAAPYHDWNERIDAECYRPNAERGSFARISFDIGPTLASWLAEHDPTTLARIVADGAGAMAQAYHHAILPLASMRDRKTEIRWGMRDFFLRFGRPAESIWLPETAMDRPTLRIAAAEGIRHTILAPWQAADPELDTRRPYLVDAGAGRPLIVAFYDRALSGAVSFQDEATADADRFGRDWVAPRFAGPMPLGVTHPLAVIATDGELYGHHKQFRDLFLQRLVSEAPDLPDRGFDVVPLASVVRELPRVPFPLVRVREGTSWSCLHGILRWMGECPCASDGRWKAPLRAAFERLAGGIDAVAETLVGTAGMEPALLWAARDRYVDVASGFEAPDAFVGRILGTHATPARSALLASVLDAQRWRLAMFASDGWYWDDPAREETRHVLRCAARAARTMDTLAGSRLEATLLDDLALLSSPSRRVDGAALYRESLVEVGQPVRV
ncbi:MAG: DUF3536 domain-containing protein [Chloroflexota bacterium]